ncbi:MAG: hypothetical protein D6765_13995 [Bacteroidetes bacterium]|nr:MAG: hypothetical protein D6765_13995 [Bacteroidota bacterium]
MKYLLFFFLATALTLAACKKDDDHPHDDGTYHVHIHIHAPQDGATVTKGQEMEVEVEFEREADQTIHNVKIEILDASGNVYETLHNRHEHVLGMFQYQSTYTPQETGTFTLRAESTSDAGDQPNEASVTFTVVE